MTEYGQRLHEARKGAKLTQVGLSKKTGIPQSTISTAETEGYSSTDTAVYAQVCGVSALWLATGEGPKHPQQADSVVQFSARESAPAPVTFDDAVRVIAQHLQQVDTATRRRAMVMLADLGEHADDYESIGAAAQAVLSTGKRLSA